MRTAFVSIPRFPCAVELQRNPHLARQPLIVGDAEQPKRVLDCSALTQAQGVCQGMTVRKALGHCPQAVVIPPDPILYRSLWESVLNALDGITPEIEDEDLGRSYLNVGGLGGLYPSEAALCEHVIARIKDVSGLAASVGLAAGKFIAFAAGTTAGPGEARVIPPGLEAGFLAPLDAGLLPVDPEIVSRLRLLGLERIGDVATLSPLELQDQFGLTGKRLCQLANGLDEEPLRSRPRSEMLSTALTFEAAVSGIDVIMAAAKQLLSRLRLPLRGRAVRELTLQAELVSNRGWERRFVFREAVSETDRLLFLLRSVLTNFPPPQAVLGLSLRLSGLTGESGKQLSLGERGRLQHQVEESIRQLKTRYGYSPIYRCLDVEPWSVIPEERHLLVESDA